jgi:hypothetical protein
MNQIFILSKNELLSAERIFKSSIAYKGGVEESTFDCNDFWFLANIGDSGYDELLIVENNDPGLLNMLILGESDFFVFDASVVNLRALRKASKDYLYGCEIISTVHRLKSMKVSKILSNSKQAFSLNGGFFTCFVKIEAIITNLANFLTAEYNNYFLKTIVDRRTALVNYYP